MLLLLLLRNGSISASQATLIQQSSIKSCLVTVHNKIVQGNSLEPMIHDGQKIKVLYNYYSCHTVARNDLVIYQYNQQRTPIIKLVKGLPGDTVSLQKHDQEWYLVINNAIAKNTQDIPYLLSQHSYRLLELYIDTYKGVIPLDTYLLLGNQPLGSFDSTALGLMGKEGLLGKAVF